MSDQNRKTQVDSIDSSIDDPMIRGGTIGFSVDDGFAEAVKGGSRRRINGSTLLFIGVLAASTAGLWSMRFLGRGVASNGDLGGRAEVGQWIMDAEKQGAVLGLDDLRVLERLDKDRLNDLQIATVRLKKDRPFRYWGEVDAADAYGMAGWNRFRRIIWPTTLRLAWPAYTNEAIFLFHATTLVFFSGFPTWQQRGDALYYASYFADKTFNPFIPYPILAFYFVVLTLCLIGLFGLINQRLNRHLPDEDRARIKYRPQIFR